MNEKLEEFKKYISGKTVTLVGAGISNMASVGLLQAYGATVTVRDKNPDPIYTPDGEGGAAVKVSPVLKKLDVKTYFGENYLDGITEDLILKAPAVRYDIPQLSEAVERGAVLTSESELFCRLCPCRIFAVTGSDGKTTTTTLIYKMLLSEAGKKGNRVWLGGNIGTPLFPQIEKVGVEDFAVLELSSFQLQTMSFTPYRAVITNISANHLNWHRDMDEYVRSKANIFAHMNGNSRLILNAGNGYTEGFMKSAKCPVTLFSAYRGKTYNDSYYLDGGDIYYYDGEHDRKLMGARDIRLVGLHNVENYMAAAAAVRGIVSDDTVLEVARTFTGVRHRIEEIREKDGVKYYNSSIDTTPSRTIAALNSFDGGVVLICGGSDKNLPLEPLIPVIMKKAKFVCATGTTGEKIHKMLIEAGYPEEKSIYEKDFDTAVKTAAGKASEGDCVLLSPAAASFDSFLNFERRGDRFRELVNNL